MRTIPFRSLEKDHLLPIEQFLFEKYRLKLETLESEQDFPPSMQELAKLHPEIAKTFCSFCEKVQRSTLSEELYLSPEFDISVYNNLRYLPKPIHMHQFFEILYIKDGYCENNVGPDRLMLRSGDICFLAPGVPHQLSLNNHETVSYSILVRASTFQRTFVDIYGNQDIISDFFTKSLYHHNQGTSPYILCKTDNEAIFLDLIDRMSIEEQNPGKFAKRYLNILFETFILELLRLHEEHFTIGKETNNIQFESITTILRYIQSNYEGLTLSETARKFRYSEAHLSRLIKKFTAQSFSEIIKTIKLQKATQLLVNSDMTIAQIVDEIGYTDNSHFYRVFKQCYGITPIQYREQKMQETF
ncbi:MAG TPA: hypothetical protein DD633_07285 [Sphaerochaeta sp.]|jgi:AraC-like DNA-binding protein/mannose-6-phosphate isomerase-like protein (cupin superfamily)|nr:hypothetical protein [Sphaerochaeta sp.]